MSDLMSEDELYRKAEKRVDEKIGFYRHLYSFIGVNVLFFIMNIVFHQVNGGFTGLLLSGQSAY